ncbi:MAG: hypothetical protein KAR38_00555 [Calditrichia bacterium]|nr:hypothetical protein [Calditrichia bacterium]
MNRALLLFIIIFFTKVYAVFADDIIREWSADPQSNSVLIQFQTANEDGVKSFVIQRSIGDSNNFEDIKEIAAVGYPNDYSYQDEVVWFQKVTTTVVYYKIAILKSNGDIIYTNSLMVMPNVNEIVKTWGSIKLLFR